MDSNRLVPVTLRHCPLGVGNHNMTGMIGLRTDSSSVWWRKRVLVGLSMKETYQ